MPDSPSAVSPFDSTASSNQALASSRSGVRFDPTQIRRPDSRLRTYYLLLGGMLGLIPVIPLLTKFVTLQYQFDESGISMKWGLFFRNEVHLTYRRIQDIHLTRNLLQRWLGLATVSLQTASGSASPEMKIEGILQADELRDYLYERMRGARDPNSSTAEQTAAVAEADAATQDVTLVLKQIRDALQRIAQGESPLPPQSSNDSLTDALLPEASMVDPSEESCTTCELIAKSKTPASVSPDSAACASIGPRAEGIESLPPVAATEWVEAETIEAEAIEAEAIEADAMEPVSMETTPSVETPSLEAELADRSRSEATT